MVEREKGGRQSQGKDEELGVLDSSSQIYFHLRELLNNRLNQNGKRETRHIYTGCLMSWHTTAKRKTVM